MSRIIFHVDVNNAFLSWTAASLLRNGYGKDIRKIASVIGGDEKSRKGVVLAKSPVAKKYGIVTAETLYSARIKCKNLVVFAPDYELYKAESRKLYNYLKNFTPVIEQYSIDECFLDLTGTSLLYGNDYIKLAERMRKEIKEKFGFTVNIGIGENKLCAKMASDFEKPDRVHTLYLNEIESKLWPLPVSDLFMLGKSSARVLNHMGIYTIEELAKADINLLERHFKSQAAYFKRASLGIDDSLVETLNSKNKCISISRTLPYDFVKREDLLNVLFDEVEEVAFSLRKQKLYAKTIAVLYKNNLFKSYSHQLTLTNPTNVTMEIYKKVVQLFNESFKEEAIRSIGVRLGELKPNVDRQLSLFEEKEIKVNDKLEEVMDTLKERFGKDSIKRASIKSNSINKKS